VEVKLAVHVIQQQAVVAKHIIPDILVMVQVHAVHKQDLKIKIHHKHIVLQAQMHVLQGHGLLVLELTLVQTVLVVETMGEAINFQLIAEV